MGKTYRIKATPGKDQNLLVQVDQDFEQLEILSLKIRQDDVYLRMCSDYGVIAGRVFANNGYGIPNAKVSVFIPLKTEDENNPIISTLYPFKSLEDTNEDGFKFNILPYIPSYAGHVPTGTFPTRKDALVNQTVVELYEKYYKYTVTTNDSGDYMIYGVPVGSQTLVMNVDLSDIGPFSLAPADLIRMGVATEEQFDGNRFKNSSNFNELPQIIVVNKSIEVSPFWGQPDLCQIGITRTDFDLTSEANIDIQPTSIFMGSLMSSTEKTAISGNGTVPKVTGDLCKMITGPGEIIAISQTIYRDSNGLPILERTKLPNGGKLIDGTGTWLFDLPMNMDYVYTNEFGEQVLSDDPSVGVPTKAKYRFKVKWQQSSSVTQDYKRAYFLIPNIKEKGWSDSGSIPVGPSQNNLDFQSSYAFSLDWSAYTSSPVVNITNPDIAEAINCIDRFYEFDYNKVYTTAQLVDNYKTNSNRERFIGIKRIDDDTCSDDVNRYPVNDGVFHTTIIWIIFNILIAILGLLFTFIILPIYHILAFIWNSWLIDLLLAFLLYMLISESINVGIAGGIAAAASDVGAAAGFFIMLAIYLVLIIAIIVYWDDIKKFKFGPIKLPMMTYPDCDTCDCDGNDSGESSGGTSSAPSSDSSAASSVLTNFTTGQIYSTKLLTYLQSASLPCFPGDIGEVARLSEQLAGFSGATENQFVPKNTQYTIGGTDYIYSTNNLPFGERINLFNSKTKYHEGFNQISVEWEPSNAGNTPHLDNTLIFISTGALGTLSAGTMMSFVNPSKSNDPNLTGSSTNSLGTNNTSGTTTYPSSISINYADPFNFNTNLIKNYTFVSTYTDERLYEYPSDVEYFQVLTGMTISAFRNISAGYTASSNFSKTFAGILESTTLISKTDVSGIISVCSINLKNIDYVDQNQNYVVILQRGVDPYSPQYSTQIGLGKIFGSNSTSDVLIDASYRLNIPIQNTTAGSNQELMFKHNGSADNTTPNNGFHLFYPSYIFTPNTTGPNSYSAYTTNRHSYYSELDSTLSYNIMTPSSSFVSHVNNSNTGVVKNLRTLTTNNFYNLSLTNNSATYQAPGGSAFESVVGSSYMWSPNISPITTVGGGGYYYSKIYNTGTTSMNMTNSNRIVMRSDRLPSSDYSGNTTYGNNTLLLQQNSGTTVYVLGGVNTVTLSGSLGTPNYTADQIQQDNDYVQVLDTFDCDNMTLLGCYQGNGLNFNINPGCASGQDDVVNGCYVLVKDPLFDLIKGGSTGDPNDFELCSEFFYRFRFNYALCQGVLSNVFNNNWINGNLYAVPFKIDTYYNSQNQISNQNYARDVIMFHNSTNNFYYRSSPWGSNSQNFCGAQNNNVSGGNNFNLKTPTTITNLGPRESFLKEISYSGDFDGYNMSGITETTYKDLGDMINFFSVIRLIDTNFWKNIFSDQIRRLFSRGGNRVDGDFAQSAAINSQLGVIPFDGNFYTTSGPNPSVIAANFVAGSSSPVAGSNITMMGIFFSSTTSDLQTRDYVSPGRVNRFNNIINQYTFDYLPIKSQVVPHYKWQVLNAGATIFGSQTNDWATNQVDILKNVKYQKLDRLTHYPYGISYDNSVPISNLSENMRGYIFGKDSSGNYQVPPPISNATLNNNPGLGGAPWYFYFGLRRGQTAINRFYTKYVGEGGLNE